MNTVAKVLLVDEAGDVLVLRRSITHPKFPHHLDLPGGEVEVGEPHAVAVKREIWEETGLDIPLELLNMVHEKVPAEGLVHVLFAARIPSVAPPVTISWEHDQFEWMPVRRLVAASVPDGADDYYLTALEYLESVS